MKIDDYPFVIRHLTREDGGGYLIEFPDLPGCISDGDTIQDAITNGFDAVECWIKVAKENNKTIPNPSLSYSGRFVQRVPKSVHARLADKAKLEGVSLNTLVTSYICEGLGLAKNEPFDSESGDQEIVSK